MCYQNKSRPRGTKNLLVDALFDLSDIKEDVRRLRWLRDPESHDAEYEIAFSNETNEKFERLYADIDFVRETLNKALKAANDRERRMRAKK